MESKYRRLGFFMALLVPLIFLAFYKTYFIDFPVFSDRIRVFDHFHAAISSVWVLMLIIQPMLIAGRFNNVHRVIGRFSYIVFPLLILSFIPRAYILFHSDHRQDLFFPVADAVVLVSLYLLAVYNKGHVAKHMRYMIASALVLLGPIIGRIGYFWTNWSALTTQHLLYGIIYAILIALIVYDGKNYHKSHPYLVAIGLFMLHHVAYYCVFL